ncbi:hypothetical protein GUITHDRAFT_109224 [Guillardia theta CCMP2712]|uniref:WW domain-containing protein n=1 Tax=Guillardia theta (strain CCMP2712) TaxID=905079 RepID=L1J927_GUITC|nr:hypothetical protein GUITHDRAFT_109224 [Guillardia theta CCMP2712]EKX44797.1 hypothetical protein GUITHDRAFT_109224 [Guillardia theta CCMP2712]|eukprot:XP_005831777.1 hypothetical protein GUITHDRAFT_109224 [Guillardia theta CCMP2712]
MKKTGLMLKLFLVLMLRGACKEGVEAEFEDWVSQILPCHARLQQATMPRSDGVCSEGILMLRGMGHGRSSRLMLRGGADNTQSSEWKMYMSRSLKKPYWVNVRTGITTWQQPAVSAPPMPRPAMASPAPRPQVGEEVSRKRLKQEVSSESPRPADGAETNKWENRTRELAKRLSDSLVSMMSSRDAPMGQNGSVTLKSFFDAKIQRLNESLISEQVDDGARDEIMYKMQWFRSVQQLLSEDFVDGFNPPAPTTRREKIRQFFERDMAATLQTIPSSIGLNKIKETDWVVRYSRSQNKEYWVNRLTGQTSWTPPQLPNFTPLEEFYIDQMSELNQTLWKSWDHEGEQSETQHEPPMSAAEIPTDLTSFLSGGILGSQGAAVDDYRDEDLEEILAEFGTHCTCEGDEFPKVLGLKDFDEVCNETFSMLGNLSEVPGAKDFVTAARRLLEKKENSSGALPSTRTPLRLSAAPLQNLRESLEQDNLTLNEFLQEVQRDTSSSGHALSKVAEEACIQSLNDLPLRLDHETLSASERVMMWKTMARSNCTLWGRMDLNLSTSLQRPKLIPQDFPSLSLALGLLLHTNRTLFLHASEVQGCGLWPDSCKEQMVVPKGSSLYFTSDRVSMPACDLCGLLLMLLQELDHHWYMEENSSGVMLGLKSLREEEDDLDSPSFCIQGKGWKFESCSLQSENGTVIMAELEVPDMGDA